MDTVLKPINLLAFSAALAACGDGSNRAFAQNLPFATATVAELNEPWAMDFLPDGRLLITEKRGALKLLDRKRTRALQENKTPAVDDQC